MLMSAKSCGARCIEEIMLIELPKGFPVDRHQGRFDNLLPPHADNVNHLALQRAAHLD
jgi:hypothetical protein